MAASNSKKGGTGAGRRKRSFPPLKIEPSDAPLCDQVREAIRRQIVDGLLAPGDALMPRRQICEHLDVNRVTVDQAVRDLITEGLLHSERGRGVFVTDVSPFTVGLVINWKAAALKDMDHGYGASLLEARRALRRKNIKTQLLTREVKDPTLKFGPPLGEVLGAQVDAYMTFGIQNEEYLAAVVGSGRPVVAVDASPLRTVFDGVVLDSFRTGYLAARHLLELGHRRIVYVGYDRGRHPGDPERRVRVPEPDSERSRAGVIFAVKEAGVDMAGLTIHLHLPPKNTAEEDALLQDFQDGRHTGAIVGTKEINRFPERSLWPESLSVVVAGTVKSVKLPRDWSIVALDSAEYSRLAVPRLLERLTQLRDKKSRARPSGSVSTIQPELIAGEATRRIGPPPELYSFHEKLGARAIDDE